MTSLPIRRLIQAGPAVLPSRWRARYEADKTFQRWLASPEPCNIPSADECDGGSHRWGCRGRPGEPPHHTEEYGTAEPVNNRSANEPVWCLGCSYKLDDPQTSDSNTPPAETVETLASVPPALGTSSMPGAPDTPPESVSGSQDSSLAYEEPGQDGGWPPAFLDDFESRVWMTYRTGFDPIPGRQTPKRALRSRLQCD